MSAQDYRLYHDKLSALRGRKCFVTMATNSIKVHIDEDKKNGIFLWLDPPWEFRKDGIVIETSASCPDHTESDYERRFRLWGSRFEPIFDSKIRDITAAPSGSLQITFTDGYEVFLPEDPSVQTDSWYDHWYL
jgi:hypothetical protein